MTDSVYGFRADYIHRLFNFAVLFFREQGLSEADLSAIQIKFILGNSIPGMLPLHIEYQNADTKLLYDITGKKRSWHTASIRKRSRNSAFFLCCSACLIRWKTVGTTCFQRAVIFFGRTLFMSDRACRTFI